MYTDYYGQYTLSLVWQKEEFKEPFSENRETHTHTQNTMAIHL